MMREIDFMVGKLIKMNENFEANELPLVRRYFVKFLYGLFIIVVAVVVIGFFYGSILFKREIDKAFGRKSLFW